MSFSPSVLVRYALFICGTVGAGMAVGMLANAGMYPWYGDLNKSVLNPPPIVFPIAWTTLYALMGAAAAWQYGQKDWSGLRLFGVQLALNLLWSFMFFTFHLITLAFVWIIALLIAVILWVRSIKSRAWQMTQIPYIAWLCFASYLSGMIVVLN